MNSFTEKQLRVTVTLAGTNQVFPGTNSNTLVLTGLRMSVRVKTVARLATDADIRVWGMQQKDMNAVTIAWANPPIIFDHTVLVEANDGNGWTQVFTGTITQAQPEYNAAPNVFMHIQAQTGYFQKIDLHLAEATSYTESVPADLALLDLITRMGFHGEVSGEIGAVTLTNPYWAGTLWDQFTKACAAVKADFYTLGDTILVTASGKPRDNQPAVVLTPESGLVGYPVYERAGLNVDALFSPAFMCGTPIDLTSDTPSATGRWYPIMTQHTLESLMPKGKWISQMQCVRVLV